MLLGYIYEVVKDKKLAEQYLISVFSQLPQHLNEQQLSGSNIFIRLQLIARKLLANNCELQQDAITAFSVTRPLPERQNKYLQRMDKTQRDVFCLIYFDGKSISDVAAELGKTEDDIRKTLQQSFTAIRKRDV